MDEGKAIAGLLLTGINLLIFRNNVSTVPITPGNPALKHDAPANLESALARTHTVAVITS
jgi:hypothetical protein